jgi:hypothetical protein
MSDDMPGNFRRDALFKKETHYAWATFLSGFAIALALIYAMPHNWAESEWSLAFVDKVASVVPIVRNLREHVPPYTPFWGLFYSVMWCLTPCYLLLGYVGSYHWTENDYGKLKDMHGGRIFLSFFVFFFTTWAWITFPWINAYSIQPSNESAGFKQLIYIFLIFGLAYVDGRILGVIQYRHQIQSRKGK